MKHDIITIGGAVADVFVDTGIKGKNGKIEYPIGAKILIDQLDFSTGGGGLNVGIALSKLGMKTAFAGKIGNDFHGKIILKEVKEKHLEFIGKISKEHPTGYSIILDSYKNERTILVYKGANNYLKKSDIKLKPSKWVYFASMIGESLKTQVNLSKRKGMKIVYNPATYLIKSNPKEVKSILKNTHLLIINKEEAKALTNSKNPVKTLCSLGPEIVCITEGDKEVRAHRKGITYLTTPNKIKIKEKTGAGDAFASAFITALEKTDDIEFALKAGSANAESTIQKLGAKNGLLTWKEIEDRIKTKSVKVRKWQE